MLLVVVGLLFSRTSLPHLWWPLAAAFIAVHIAAGYVVGDRRWLAMPLLLVVPLWIAAVIGDSTPLFLTGPLVLVPLAWLAMTSGIALRSRPGA